MTRPAAQAYIDTRETDPELETLNAEYEAADDAPDAEEEHEHEGPGVVDPALNVWQQLERSVKDPGKYTPNALAAMYDAIKNMGSTVADAMDAVSDAGTAAKEKATGEKAPEMPSIKEQFMAGGGDEFLHFTDQYREAIRKQSTSGDVMVQKTLQFAVPMAGFSKALNVAKSGSKLATVAKVALADALTNATVWDPYETRFGEMLVALAPENGNQLLAPFTDFLLNAPNPFAKTLGASMQAAEKGVMAFAEYVSPEEGDTPWEGRWKNTVDSFGLNAALSAVGVGVTKIGGAMIKRGHEAHHMADPHRTAAALDEWVTGRPKGPQQTVEIFSEKSEQGRHITAARELAAGTPGEADILERDLMGAQTEGMRSAQESGAYQKLVQAITGRRSELVGMQVPSAASPFDFSGTFEGGISPNMRVPLVGMTDDELKRMNAVVGKEWDQDAMVSAESVPTAWEAAVPEGYTRSASIVATATETDARALAIKVRSVIPAEHEFAIHALPKGGYIVDIFPKFTDSGQVGIGMDTAQRISDELGEGFDTFASDYRSVYTTRDEYDEIIGGIRGQATDVGTGEGARDPALDDLLAEAQAGLRSAREVYEGKAGQAVERSEFRVEGEKSLSAYPQTPARAAAQAEIDSMQRAGGLDEYERSVEDTAAAWVHASPRRAMRQYAQLPDTDGGRILSVDSARELDPRYRNDRTLSAAVHEPMSALMKAIYELQINKPPRAGQEPLVLFSAGGTGAGKTTGLKETIPDVTGRAQVVLDSNLQNFGSSVDKIDDALNAGKSIIIAYTYRDPLDALANGALSRAARQEAELGSGRTIKIKDHLETHLRSNNVVDRLAKHYADNPAVKFIYIDNSHGKGGAHVWEDPARMPVLVEKDYDVLYEEAVRIIEEQRAAGKVSDAVADAFLDTPASKSATRNRRRDRGKPEPERAAGSGGQAPTSRVGPQDTDAFGAVDDEIFESLDRAIALVAEGRKATPEELAGIERALMKTRDLVKPDATFGPTPEAATRAALQDVRGTIAEMTDDQAESFLGRMVDSFNQIIKAPKGSLQSEIDDILEHQKLHERGPSGESVIDRKVRERKQREKTEHHKKGRGGAGVG